METRPLDKRVRSADRMGTMITTVPKWIALAVVAWQARLSIEALSGRSGLASLAMRFDRQTTLWELVCWAAGAVGLVCGIYSRMVLGRLRPRR